MHHQDSNCVFCKIVAGEIPSMIVKDTPYALSFMDVGPLADAHLLLIPKQHYVRLDEMPVDDLVQTTSLLPMLTRAVMQVSGASAYNILQNNGAVSGQAVLHVHFHIIPRHSADGLGYRWNAGQYEPGRDKQIHESILAALPA